MLVSKMPQTINKLSISGFIHITFIGIFAAEYRQILHLIIHNLIKDNAFYQRYGRDIRRTRFPGRRKLLKHYFNCFVFVLIDQYCFIGLFFRNTRFQRNCVLLVENVNVIYRIFLKYLTITNTFQKIWNLKCFLFYIYLKERSNLKQKDDLFKTHDRQVHSHLVLETDIQLQIFI